MTVEQVSNSTGTVLYLHHDQQGSTRLLTGSTGKTEATSTYDAYGNKTGSTGTSTTPLGYDAQYTSPDTGLIYLRNRAYDPTTGQFLSVDPLDSITQAPYNYANDNPVNENDLTGLLSVDEVLRGAGKLGAKFIGSTPAGEVLQVASKATGLTIGECVGAGVTGGGAAHIQVCYAATPSGSNGLTATVGGGAGFPISANVSSSLLLSNGQTLGDQAGKFAGGGGTVLVVGGSYSRGSGECGEPVWQATGGLSVGPSLPPLPASGYGGWSYTWTAEE